MTEHSPLEVELAAIIAEALDLNAHIDSNRPDVIKTIWASAGEVAKFILEREKTNNTTLVNDIIDTIQYRVNDLNNCHKDDDCKVIAEGASLALDDVDWNFAGGKEKYDAEHGEGSVDHVDVEGLN